MSKKRKSSQEKTKAGKKSRMVGPKSKTRKLEEKEPLLGIEDIDPYYKKSLASSVRHPMSAPAA